MNKIRIVAAIATRTGITLYLETGKELNLPMLSYRTKSIIDDTVARLARHEIVEIDLDTYSIEARIAEKTGGLLRFVKKTKSFVKNLFGATSASPEAQPDEIVQVAPTVDPANEPAEEETELVAVVTDAKTGEEILVPGVVALEKHVEHAVTANNVVGLQRFMQRLADMNKTRSHTVQELLRFMERGDLPIADDGTIVAYKVLQSISRDEFVDCYSKQVRQRLGSKVTQDESLIDQNRRNECSTGLHIARRGYLHGFSGDIITIVKVAPEDVVAVPNCGANKMRAAAYHIVGVLPSEVHSVLRSNRPMTGNLAASQMLADVIAGNHVGVTEIVRITSAMGGSFVVEKVGEAEAIVSGQNGFSRALDAPIVGMSLQEIRTAAQAGYAEAINTPSPIKDDEGENELAEEQDRDDDNTVEESSGDVYRDLDVERPAEPEQPVETKAERDARRKREKRAAAKLETAQETRKNPPSKLPVPTAAPATSGKAALRDAARLEREQKAFEMADAGKSLREIEREVRIDRKRLSKLLKDRAASKAAE